MAIKRVRPRMILKCPNCHGPMLEGNQYCGLQCYREANGITTIPYEIKECDIDVDK